MRLIDADKAIARAKEEAAAMSEPFKSQFGLLVEWIVGKTSTAYDVDKVVEQLEKEKQINMSAKSEAIVGMCGASANFYSGEECAYQRAIEIVKAGGIDGNN